MKNLVNEIFNGVEGDFKVLEQFRKGKYVSYKIKFLNTGFEKIINSKYVRNGSKIKNKGLATICGVGIVNKKITDEFENKVYNTWRQMLKRCYQKDYAKQHKINEVKVCEYWLYFENFLIDVSKIDGFDEEQYINGQLVLDKDIKSREKNEITREYSINTVKFVNKSENQSVSQKTKKIKAVNGKTEIICNSINEMARHLKINPKTVTKYLNSTYLGWSFEEIKIKR